MWSKKDHDGWTKGSVWRLDGDGEGWVMVSAFPVKEFEHIGLRNLNRRICTTSSGKWLAILEDNNSFNKMNIEDLATDYWNFKDLHLSCRSRQAIYVETIVSPNS